MITKEQVNQVQEWGKGKNLTDAVKQFVNQKNNKKAGKTVNGTFVKAEDLV